MSDDLFGWHPPRRRQTRSAVELAFADRDRMLKSAYEWLPLLDLDHGLILPGHDRDQTAANRSAETEAVDELFGADDKQLDVLLRRGETGKFLVSRR